MLLEDTYHSCTQSWEKPCNTEALSVVLLTNLLSGQHWDYLILSRVTAQVLPALVTFLKLFIDLLEVSLLLVIFFFICCNSFVDCTFFYFHFCCKFHFCLVILHNYRSELDILYFLLSTLYKASSILHINKETVNKLSRKGLFFSLFHFLVFLLKLTFLNLYQTSFLTLKQVFRYSLLKVLAIKLIISQLRDTLLVAQEPTNFMTCTEVDAILKREKESASVTQLALISRHLIRLS